jgi:hypothetical protein
MPIQAIGKNNGNSKGKSNYRGPSLRSRMTDLWSRWGVQRQVPIQGSLRYVRKKPRTSVEMTKLVERFES